MSKTKKPAKEPPTVRDAAADAKPLSHAELRQPANPPRPRLAAFLIALAAFFAWFVYLVYVAAFG